VVLFVLLREKRLRQTRQRLAESEDRFRLLFEHGGVGMALLSSDGHFVQVNPALVELLGHSAPELVGRHLLDVVYEQDRIHSNLLQDKPDAPRYEREKRLVHREGQLIWTRIVRVPIRDIQGAIRYHATFFVDISGGKRAEEALRQQQRMEEQLHRARRMETLVTLVGGIAHDFNNQLTAILGNLDLLRMDLEPGHPNGKSSLESIRSCLRGVEQAGQRCARMTARLLTFSRGQLGTMQIVALDSLLTETAAALQHELPGLKIEVHTPPGNYPVTVDPAQIQELLLNLAINASEAMPDGGTLTLALAQRTFTAEDSAGNHEVRAGTFVELRVQDTGRGIAPENLDYIFDPFFTTKKPPQGAGMGLSVVFGIVKGHKGWIMVESQLGKGTTFHIYLPAAPAPAPSVSRPAMPAVQRITGERILVVDDEPLVRDLAKTVLSRRGFRVVTAEDGDEALDLYRREGGSIDVILLDYIMPRMNGMQVLKELQQLNPNVRVLFSSGYHTDHEVDQLLAAGARGFVAKPYRAQDLVHSIRQVLGHTKH
jgi:PAS domain S-box-containing protein